MIEFMGLSFPSLLLVKKRIKCEVKMVRLQVISLAR
jgi:hypothetical protein